MLLEMNNKDDFSKIRKYGKAYGVYLLKYLLPKICDITNFYIFDSYDEYKKIEDKLPNKFILRGDAIEGEKPTLGVRGGVFSKAQVLDYINEVKKNNIDGVVLCIETNLEKKQPPIDCSFNVYFEWDKKVYIDYLTKGFDVGGITKGEDNHEVFEINFKDILFVTPENMNNYRTYLISSKTYKESLERKIKYIMDKKHCTYEEVLKEFNIEYVPMSLEVKRLLLEDIILEILLKKDEISKLNLKSFGVQGMVRDGILFPVEVNRSDRFKEKDKVKRKDI
jgi:hypothetical protein